MTDVGRFDMSGDEAARALFEVHAKQSITDTMVRWARGADRADFDMITSTYHEGAFDDHSGGTAPDTEDGVKHPRFEGSPEVFARLACDAMHERDAGQHYISNINIELEGEVAHCESYWLSVSTAKGDEETVLVEGGRYADRFELRDGEWKIAFRRFIIEWGFRAPAAFIPLPPHFRFGASRDRNDVSYDRSYERSRP
jgi:hypothetical protein